MHLTKIYVAAVFTGFFSLSGWSQQHFILQNGKYMLTATGASHLAGLPLKCIRQEYPYKTGVVFADSSLQGSPKNYHPSFYGCFDWHSSVHGHWMLIKLVKLYPQMPQADTIRKLLKEQLSYRNIQGELKLFKQKDNRTFERTYGWAWLLQMQKELLEWDDTLGRQLSSNLQPLADRFSVSYREFLSKLVYPLRVGEHSNLAFGLRLAWDYAQTKKDDSLMSSIRNAALQFYKNDVNCPISWEPGGTDFLSPCLEEADLMWRILPAEEYERWIEAFLPMLFQPSITLEPGRVKDRSDGRLVHLDGLNFSRAWCLYGIAAHVNKNKEEMLRVANMHLATALPHVASGEYMGEHWLASFAVYALAAGRLN
jgi:hypothetical protein